MPSKWYLQVLEVGKHLIQNNRDFHDRRPKYISLCSCGDIHASSNKSWIEDHRNLHIWGKSKTHKVQIFKEDKTI